MTKEERIELAKVAGLVYSGDNEYDEPEFIGTEHHWQNYQFALDEALKLESDRLVYNDKANS